MRIPNNVKHRALAIVMAAAMTVNLASFSIYADDEIAAGSDTSTAASAETVDSTAASSDTLTDSDAQKDPDAAQQDSEAASDSSAPEASSQPESDSMPAATETPAPYRVQNAAESDTAVYADAGTSTTASNDLRKFVDSVSIEDPKPEESDGKTILYPGSKYKFKLSFSEQELLQMDTEGNLTYTFPEQLRPDATSGTFQLNVKVGSQTLVINDNKFTISGNTMTVTINKDSPNYAELQKAANAQFDVKVDAEIAENASGDNIDFGNGKTLPTTYPTNAEISTKKEAKYDKAAGKVTYTVEVTSTGTAKDVLVSDTITGDALKYVQDSLRLEPNVEGGQLTEQTDTGFRYTLPTITNGQTVKLIYEAEVDYTKLDGKTEFTADETGNTVSVKAKNSEKSEASTDLTKDNNNKKISTSIAKEGTADPVTEDNKQTVHWTITVNQEAHQIRGGETVTDTLETKKSDGSDLRAKTHYSGEGVTVTWYTRDNKQAGTKLVSWEELQVTKDSTGFELKLPGDATDTKPYYYKLTYTTESDVSKVWNDAESLTNKATLTDTTTSKDVAVGPSKENGFHVTKEHTLNWDSGIVNWKVTVTVPDSGFDENDPLELTDTLPSTWKDNNKYMDSYIDGTMQVMLGDKELQQPQYTLTYNDNSQNNEHKSLKLNFSKNSLPEIFAPGKGRVLTLTYQTKPADGWPADVNHMNKVEAKNGTYAPDATNSYQYVEQELKKNANGYVYDDQDKVHLFGFDLIMQGMHEDSVTIHGKFDTSKFEIYTNAENRPRTAIAGAGENSWDATNYANDYAWNSNVVSAGTVMVKKTEDGADITLTNPPDVKIGAKIF